MVKVSASVRERQLEKEREKQARAAREAAIVVENFPIVIGDAAQKKQEVLLKRLDHPVHLSKKCTLDILRTSKQALKLFLRSKSKQTILNF